MKINKHIIRLLEEEGVDVIRIAIDSLKRKRITSESKTDAIRRLGPVIASIENISTRQDYICYIAEKFNASIQVVYRELRHGASQKKKD